MSEATILSVREEMGNLKAKDNWPAKKIINGTLRDGQGEADFSAFVKIPDAEKVQGELKALIGKSGDFDLQPSKRGDYNGRRQLDMKGWPGKPQQQGGGGRGNWQPSYEQTEVGFREKNIGIARQVALKAAVEFHCATANGLAKEIGDNNVIETAQRFLAFLTADAPKSAPAQATPSTFNAEKAIKASLALLGVAADHGAEALDTAWRGLSASIKDAIRGNPQAIKDCAVLRDMAKDADRLQHAGDPF